MWVCYVDESGCRGALPSSTSEIQPVLVLGALALPLDAIRSLTLEMLRIKRRFFPRLLQTHPRFLDGVRYEIKGSNIRKEIARGDRGERRHGIGLIDKLLRLLARHTRAPSTLLFGAGDARSGVAASGNARDDALKPTAPR